MKHSSEERPADEERRLSSREIKADESDVEENPGILREFFEFLREEKKWWIAPLLVALAVMAVIAALAGSAAAPFIYSLY